MQYDYHNLTISFFTPKLQFASISGYPLRNIVDSVSRQAKHETHSSLESLQDFLITLGIKPLMHLLEKGTFSLNNVIVTLTKIMNRADKNWAHF